MIAQILSAKLGINCPVGKVRKGKAKRRKKEKAKKKEKGKKKDEGKKEKGKKAGKKKKEEKEVNEEKEGKKEEKNKGKKVKISVRNKGHPFARGDLISCRMIKINEQVIRRMTSLC